MVKLNFSDLNIITLKLRMLKMAMQSDNVSVRVSINLVSASFTLLCGKTSDFCNQMY